MKKADDLPLYQFLVELAEFDPETARPGDWLNYQSILTGLVLAANVQMRTHHISDKPQKLRDPETEVRAVHPDLRQLVRQFAAGGRVKWIPVTAEVAVFGGETPTGRLMIHGNRRDTVLLMAARLLARWPERAPIEMCPEDHRVFLRVRRQQYCSRQCVNRANARAYRQRALEKKSPTRKQRPR